MILAITGAERVSLNWLLVNSFGEVNLNQRLRNNLRKLILNSNGSNYVLESIW